MQLQNLLSLGQALKEKREDQGLSLEKISDWTKINVSTLQAIEEAQVDRLPVYAYLRGFILAYSKALGMDEKEIERELKTLISQNENLHLHNINSAASGSSAAAENFVEKDLRLTPVILAVSILFIFGSILVFTNIIQSYKKEPELRESPVDHSNQIGQSVESEKEEKHEILSPDSADNNEQESGIKKNEIHKEGNPPTIQKSIIKLKQKEPEEQEKLSVPQEVKSKQLNHQKTSLELVVKALGEVKVFYQVDGKEEKEVSLKEDQFEVLQGKESILIKTSNSDLIYIFHNGKDIGLFGSGGKKEKTFN